jgi:hypothetical protein
VVTAPGTPLLGFPRVHQRKATLCADYRFQPVEAADFARARPVQSDELRAICRRCIRSARRARFENHTRWVNLQPGNVDRDDSTN